MVKGVEIKVTLGRDILIEEISALWLMGFDATVVQPTNRVGTLGYDLVWRHSGAWQKTS